MVSRLVRRLKRQLPGSSCGIDAASFLQAVLRMRSEIAKVPTRFGHANYWDVQPAEDRAWLCCLSLRQIARAVSRREGGLDAVPEIVPGGNLFRRHLRPVPSRAHSIQTDIIEPALQS